MIGKLVSQYTDSAPTVVLDAEIATEENIAWLVENSYRYLVVSRKRHREFDSDAAVLIKEDGEVRLADSTARSGEPTTWGSGQRN